MTSRMERYYRPLNRALKRSERNERLYHEIYDNGEYSNIEGIATIEKSNEVDITKIKNMLKNREQYQKQREYRQAIKEENPKVKPIFEERKEAERTYDIRDILNKAKTNKISEEKYHRLDDTGYHILKDLKEKSMKAESKEELRELIDTITNHSELNQLATRELSLDMFEDLKSKDNTVIQGRDSIKTLLEQAKEEERKKREEEQVEMDKSFYTSSLNFGQDDFEQLQDMKYKTSKKRLFIKGIIFVILILATAGIIFLIYNLIK